MVRDEKARISRQEKGREWKEERAKENSEREVTWTHRKKKSRRICK